MKKNNRIILIIIIVFVAINILGIIFLSSQKINDDNSSKKNVTLSEIQSQSSSVFEYMRKNIAHIVGGTNIDDALELTHEAFKQKSITMYECHALTHSIGHQSTLAPVTSLGIAEKIGQINLCEGGFRHGLEAEIVLRGLNSKKDFRPQLYQFCSILLKALPNADCYHGAGHEFIRETMDSQSALALCNTLVHGPMKKVTNCYYGVFAEYTNLLGGVDGQTGYAISTGPPLELSSPSIDFCASLSTDYQKMCALELSGLGFDPQSTYEDFQQGIFNCVDNTYSTELQNACIRSRSAVFYQHQLAKEETSYPPTYVLSWTKGQREAYIDGAATEMSEYIKNGVNKDWEIFCDSFSGTDRDLCAEKFNKKISYQQNLQ